MHIQVKALPESLRRTLSAVAYGARDIEVSPAETFTVQDFGGDGRRAFIFVVDLKTGRYEAFHGSWGGPNIFDRSNPVDNDATVRPLPEGFAVISGSTGHGVYASIQVNPKSLAPLLPAAPAVALSPVEAETLRIYREIRGGRRDEYLTGYSAGGYRSVTDRRLTFAEVSAALLSLSAKGLLKVNKAGATSVTTEGKNFDLGPYIAAGAALIAARRAPAPQKSDDEITGALWEGRSQDRETAD